jgi:hypothetical protein
MRDATGSTILYYGMDSWTALLGCTYIVFSDDETKLDLLHWENAVVMGGTTVHRMDGRINSNNPTTSESTVAKETRYESTSLSSKYQKQ